MLDRIQFLVGEAVVALRRNSLMTFAAVTTVAVSLFLLGGLGYLYLRMSEYSASLPSQFDARVFLKDGTSKEKISELAQEFRKIPGVQTCVWIPRDAYWKKVLSENPDWQQDYGADPNFENPYPDAFKIVWSDLDLVRDATATIGSHQEVDSVEQFAEEQRVIAQIQHLIRGIGIGLGGLLFLTGGILIYNAIRLTVIARRREIRIMQLVGATRATVQVPFLIEGVIQGAIGGALACLILLAAHTRVMGFVRSLDAFQASESSFPIWSVLALLCGAGAAYGLLCSFVAVREPSKIL